MSIKRLTASIMIRLSPESTARMRKRIRGSIRADNMRGFWQRFVNLSWQEGLPL